MPDSITTTAARKLDIGKIAAAVFEWLGVLNKGSSTSPATPSTEEAVSTAGVNTNTLNVTRVGGIGALVTASGAAAIAIFNLKDNTADTARMAAFISVGVIVAAALLTAGMIITADIRSRFALGAAAATAAASTSTADSVVATWRQVIYTLGMLLGRLEADPAKVVDAWLDASATGGLVAPLKPPAGEQPLHALLQAGHSLFLERMRKLIDEGDATKRAVVLTGLRELVASMEQNLPSPA